LRHADHRPRRENVSRAVAGPQNGRREHGENGEQLVSQRHGNSDSIGRQIARELRAGNKLKEEPMKIALVCSAKPRQALVKTPVQKATDKLRRQGYRKMFEAFGQQGKELVYQFRVLTSAGWKVTKEARVYRDGMIRITDWEAVNV
jgi:hypothetical protein